MNDTTVIQPFPTDLYEAARWFTSTGFSLFPVKLTPYTTKEGHQKLEKKPLGDWDTISTHDDFIIDLLNRSAGWTPSATIDTGLALGLDCRKSGLFILDIDLRASSIYPEGSPGMESLAALEEKYGKLPTTWVSQTPSGGLHYWFRGHGRNSASSKELGAGLDTRGDGGFIVTPPSRVEDGTFYEWENPPDIFELADAPDWLIELTTKKEREYSSGEYSGDFTTIDYDADIPEGKRNDTLFKYACAWRAEGRDEDEIFARLVIVNEEKCQPPVEKEELQRIAWSAMRYEPDPEQVRKAKLNETLEELSGAFLEQQERLHEQLRQQEEADRQQWEEAHPDDTPWELLNEEDQLLRIVELEQDIDASAQEINVKDRDEVNQFRMSVLRGYWKDQLPREVIEQSLDKLVPLPEETELFDDIKNAGKDVIEQLTKIGKFLVPEAMELVSEACMDSLVRHKVKEFIKDEGGIPDVIIDSKIQEYLTRGRDTKPYFLDELLNEPDDPFTWIVDGLIAPGSTSLVAGVQKGGKSSFGQTLIFSASTGEPFLGRTIPRPFRVLYLCLEDPKKVFKEKMKKMLTNHQMLVKPVVLFSTQPSRIIQDMRYWVETAQVELIIIDTLVKVLPEVDMNSYQAMSIAMATFTAFASQHNVHIMLFHHNNKMSGERAASSGMMGSAAIPAATETNISITKMEQTGERFIKSESRIPTSLGMVNFNGERYCVDEHTNRGYVLPPMSKEGLKTADTLKFFFALGAELRKDDAKFTRNSLSELVRTLFPTFSKERAKNLVSFGVDGGIFVENPDDKIKGYPSIVLAPIVRQTTTKEEMEQQMEYILQGAEIPDDLHPKE